jgi:phage repressor protein C with HTH and peptisase S24 domain
MGWATAAIDRLRQGQAVVLRPRGHSMAGKVDDGDLVTVEPLGERELRVGDIVLVRRHGREYLHLVMATQGGRYLIGNHRGGVNGWVGRHAIAGIATTVTPSRA